jgi:hypothetical protein
MIDHRSWTLPREIGRPQRQAQTEAAVGCCWRDFDEYAQHSSISTAQTHQLGAACVQESIDASIPQPLRGCREKRLRFNASTVDVAFCRPS